MKKFSKTVAVIGCVAILGGTVGALAGCNNDGAAKTGEFTFRSYTTALGTNWNPHSWETNADDSVNSYITSPGITMQILDSEEKTYQWVYEMVTSLTDVTAAHKSDLTKYYSSLPSGVTSVDDVTGGYVYEIALNRDAVWQNGDKITAEDWVYSMKAQLDPEMKNYRSNLYWSGEGAIAGALDYYNLNEPIYTSLAADRRNEVGDNQVYISLSNEYDIGYTLKDLYEKYGVIFDGAAGGVTYSGETYYKQLLAARDTTNTDFGADEIYVPYNDTTKAAFEAVVNQALTLGFGIPQAALADYYDNYRFAYDYTPTGTFEELVGVYKVDDYTFRYVTKNEYDINDMRINLASPWLVHKATYEAGFDKTGTLKTTNYGTSVATSMSYGPYKLESVQEGRQMVFVQNENWYGWEEENGQLVSYTPYLVDGKHVQRYQTTRIVYDVLTTAAAKQNFERGLLSEYSPTASELSSYSLSDQLLQAPETYTMSLFFNSDVEALKKMDTSGGNTNSVVLSNINFRKAMSLAINRSTYVVSTPGYVAAYSLMNSLYYYDIFNDPASSYRSSDVAMQAICNLYGVEYGEDKVYKTLELAYESITGYNIDEAKALMKTACDELVAAGLYTAGQDITIRMAWKAGALEADDNAQVTALNNFVNAALEGSGFGKVTLEALGNITNRYDDVPNGVYAIGYGAWGGAALYPFRNMQVYTNTDSYNINEAGCWDPETTMLTLEIPAFTSTDGTEVAAEEVTMSWKDWGDCLIGGGKFFAAPNSIKLYITAQLEENFLNFYYRIPLCSTTVCSLYSYQFNYYTTEYNIMYGYGGFELLSYNYNDTEWATYVAQEGGTLSYV